MRTAAYKVDVASVYVSLRSLLNECHWHSATPQARECAKAHSLFMSKNARGILEHFQFNFSLISHDKQKIIWYLSFEVEVKN